MISGLEKPIKFTQLRKDDNFYISYASTNMVYTINGKLIEEDNLKVQGDLLLKNRPIEIQASFSDYSAPEKEQALKDINMWVTSLLEVNKI